MAARSDEVFDRGLDVFSDVVGRLAPTDWDRPSPDEGWTALDVLGHLGSSIAFGIAILRGDQPTWPDFDRPADLVDGEPEAWWTGIRDDARAALDGADLDLVMDTPMGPRTVADRLAFPAIDLYVHAWDLGRVVGADVEVPGDVIDFAHGYLDGFPPEQMRGEGKPFGPEVEPPADATASEAFIAWTGRTPR